MRAVDGDDPSVLTTPLAVGPVTAPSRVVFGPHETNLGRGRAISERHVAYYRRRAAGGAGVIVTEEASVHDSDWPYERAPSAPQCGAGWSSVVEACAPHSTVVLAALGHAGGQGTSHWSQRELWAPGSVPEVNTREVPKVMEDHEVEAVISGFVRSARLAVDAGCAGVEINAGQYSLARQFLSGLTNTRDDRWGADRSEFLRRVLDGVRDAIGPTAVLALRLSCDELAPWAGITPEMAPGLVAELVSSGESAIDMLTVVRGSIYSAGATRPDGHTAEGFNTESAIAVASSVEAASNGHTVVVAQGSIVEPVMAESLLRDSPIGAVEMTRAQIADAELVVKLRSGRRERIRPCVLCNQTCMVRDNRNPIISCVVDPFSGHETTEAMPVEPPSRTREVVVVGGGPAGLEAARVAGGRGHVVRLHERGLRIGGRLHTVAAQPGRHRFALFAEWLESECRAAGVEIATGSEVTPTDVTDAEELILATGGRDGERRYATTAAANVLSAEEVLSDPASWPDGDVLVWDPIGGPTGVAVAEVLAGHPGGDGEESAGRTVHLVTQDYIVGNELARSGDLGPANARLAHAGVVMHRRRILRKVRKSDAVLEDRFSQHSDRVAVAWVVDCGHRLPEDTLMRAMREADGRRPATAGDCVAPRTVAESVLEGRRRALELG